MGRPQSEAYSFQISNASKTSITYGLGSETHTVKPGFAVRHSECLPNTVKFIHASAKGRKKRLDARYTAGDGRVYIVKGPSLASVSISVERKRTLSRSLSRRRPADQAAFGGATHTGRAPPLPARSPAPLTRPKRTGHSSPGIGAIGDTSLVTL